MKTLFTWFNTVLNNRRVFKRETLNANLQWPVSLSLGAKYDVEDLILNNQSLIDKARYALPCNAKEFERWILPIIQFIAKYYLYLPRSNEHHQNCSSLFKYSLHSAVCAATLINRTNPVIYNKIDGEYRHQYKLTYPLSVFIFALIHDTGKPISDYKVYSCNRKGVVDNCVNAWNPTKETLYEWIKVNKTKYYLPVYSSINNKEIYTYISLSKLESVLETFTYSKLLKEQLSKMLCDFDDNSTRQLLKIVALGKKGYV
jgi:hypothetical protein